MCNRVLRDAQEAEEAAQDSFVKVYQHITGYQGGSKFSTWLYSIAYRTAISKLRARPGGTSGLDDITDEVVAEHEEPIAEATDRRVFGAPVEGSHVLFETTHEDRIVAALHGFPEEFCLGEEAWAQ